jgi:hypothetical protein
LFYPGEECVVQTHSFSDLVIWYAATAVAGPAGSLAYAMLEMNHRQKDPDSKAAGAWAIPTALPSSPIQLPSIRHPLGIGTENSRQSSKGDSQPDQRIIFDEFGRL